MALDPLKQRLEAGSVPLVNQGSYLFNEVLVQHGLAIGLHPVVLLPRSVPVCRAIDGVFAVGENSDFRILFCSFQRTDHGSKLGSLVGLSLAPETF